MFPAKDKTQFEYNDLLTLSGVPPHVYDYRLGNRRTLEWMVNRHRVSKNPLRYRQWHR